MSELIFPLRQRPDIDYSTGGRKFGASRDSGNRRHAGCDLIAPEGTEILSMADGTVIRGPYFFYSGTYAIEVRLLDGKVIRYGETSRLGSPGLGVGTELTQGQVIARVGRLDSGSSMLHLEMYSGTVSGSLTQAGNAFKRRADLIDPTPHLDAARLLDEAPAIAVPAAPSPSVRTGRVGSRVTSKLRVRSEPSTTAMVQFELSPGEQIRVRAEVRGGAYDTNRTDWLEIEHNGRSGFAAGNYIEIDGASASAAIESEDRWIAALRRASLKGASASTAAQDGLQAGVPASHAMAETDLGRVLVLADRFLDCARKFGLPAALLAALASRESRCGKVLQGGWGDRGNGFGIMQVDKRYHEIKGQPDPASSQHVEQAADIFCDYLEEVARRHPGWRDEHLLQGAAVAYNSGVGNVRTVEGMDKGTTGDDYGSDVLARAQFYLDHASLEQFRS